jgi:lipopolysaccharide/colanic/teichoic acid biosynthesis glycosyltransferase
VSAGNLARTENRPRNAPVSDTLPDDLPAETPGHSNRTRYAYMRRDGTLDIVLGSLVAGVGAYIYQFIGGRSLGEEAFAPIAALLTAHFLAFVIILLPIEQFVIRRLTLGYRGWVVPARAVALVVSTGVVAAVVVWSSADTYFDGDASFVWFVIATVAFHFFFVVGRGYLAGYRRFRSYGYVSGAASVLRLVIAIAVVMVGPTVTGFAWAQVLGPLVIILWRPWRVPKRRVVGSRGELGSEDIADIGERGLLSGLVLSSAASQALLLAGPLAAGALGATASQFSITYATLLLARAPLTLGYNLIARVLPPFTEMAVRGERRELRSWARGMGIAGAALAFLGAGLGALLGPTLVAIAFGDGFRPTATVAALAAAGVVLASAGLFIGQILVARGRAIRLAVAWAVAVVGAFVVLVIPMEDPVFHVVLAFVIGEALALSSLVLGALLRDPEEGEISHGYVVAKRSLDIAVALVALMLLAPVLAAAAIGVRIGSRGPAFFRQLRTGRNGRDFWMVKLRTMVIDHEEEVFHEHLDRLRYSEDDDEYTIRIDDDPRITRVGGFLRRWSLDELPNFWNVLKGSMSLVGPRPLVPEEADLVGLDNPRFDVKPGITGYAQVHGRDSISVAERTALDEEYVETCSMKMDVKILLETFGAVLRTKGEESKV